MNTKPGDFQNNENAFRIAALIAAYIGNALSAEEKEELEAWLRESAENRMFFEKITNEKTIEADLEWMEQVYPGPAMRKIHSQLSFNDEPKPHFITRWQPYIIAACFILLIVLAHFFGIKEDSFRKRGNELTSHLDAPATNQPTLRLSDGSIISLENSANGIIQNEQGTSIRKTAEGALVYENNSQGLEVINTLNTPTGGQYTVLLSDGTRVQLNAQSSISFPTQFIGGERVVQLTGEGYFEVAKDPSRPFIVQLDQGKEIRVLGTSFNIMAYATENSQKITLVEGSVQVSSFQQKFLLAPGQVALIDSNGNQVVNKADLQKELAWTNGEFIFRNASIEEIMRGLARWYHIEVDIKANTSERFSAGFQKTWPLEKVISQLQETGRLRFTMKGNKLTVSN